MAENYPKMLYDRDYNTHCDVPNHDHDRASRKRACTVTAINPDDHAEKLKAGYRESPADFLEGESDDVVENAPAIAPPPRRNGGRRTAVEDPPKIEG